MKTIIITIVSISVLAGFVLLAFTALSQNAMPTAAGDMILNIPASEFNELEDGYDFKRNETIYFETGSGVFFAPVSLPHGSRIQKVILVCKDNNWGNYVWLTLRRITREANSTWWSFTDLVSVNSTGSDVHFRDFTMRLTSDKYVNAWEYTFYLSLKLPGTQSDGYEFLMARIVYTPPS